MLEKQRRSSARKIRAHKHGIPDDLSNSRSEENALFTPEQRLLGAILARAIIDVITSRKYKAGLMKHDYEKFRPFELDVWRWFYEDWIHLPEYGSFQYVCEALAEEPENLREKVFTILNHTDLITCSNESTFKDFPAFIKKLGIHENT